MAEQLVELDDDQKESLGEEAGKQDATDPLSMDYFALKNANNEVVALVDIEDMGIVIAWSEVESFTIYDDDLYKAFQAQGPVSKAHIVDPGSP